jgi:hypothetical protein
MSLKSVPTRLDAANIAGITSLMNVQFMDKSRDPDEEEKKIMGQESEKQKKYNDADPVKMYTNELEYLADELGIESLGGESKKHRENKSEYMDDKKTDDSINNLIGIGNKQNNTKDREYKNNRSKSTNKYNNNNHKQTNNNKNKRYDKYDRYEDDDDEDDFEDEFDEGDEFEDEGDFDDEGDEFEDEDDFEDEGDEFEDEFEEEFDDRPNRKSSRYENKSYERDNYRSGGKNNKGNNKDWLMGREMPRNNDNRNRRDDYYDRDRKNRMYSNTVQRVGNDFGIDFNEIHNRDHVSDNYNDMPAYERRDRDRDRYGNSYRNESNIVEDVLRDMRNETTTEYATEKEDIRDKKARKLEEIAQLKSMLEGEGVDISSVSSPTLDDSEEKIEQVLKILKLKMDRIRYSSLAEEIILGLAEGVETVFDGTREIPIVGWKPDYTDYHNTVNVKLHRMRFETSQVVNDTIQNWKLGPLTRIAVELLPSFFLYPRQRSKQKNTPGLYDDLNKNAYNNIRNMDDYKSMNDIASV